jgi:hypothetical protein
MPGKFRFPDFSKAELELRFENGVVCIYGTPDGLRKLAEVCQDLAENYGQGHIHLDRDEMAPVELTDESEEGAIAVFTEKK